MSEVPLYTVHVESGREMGSVNVRCEHERGRMQVEDLSPGVVGRLRQEDQWQGRLEVQ